VYQPAPSAAFAYFALPSYRYVRSLSRTFTASVEGEREARRRDEAEKKEEQKTQKGEGMQSWASGGANSRWDILVRGEDKQLYVYAIVRVCTCKR